jgi:hypothetical protein
MERDILQVKMKNKKGISVMIGYVLLIVAAIVLGAIVYSWLSSYVPTEDVNCPDGSSLFVKSLRCGANNYTGGYQFNMTLKNNGRFDLGGYFIYATDNPDKELATIILAENITSGAVRFGNGLKFLQGEDNSFEPGEEVVSSFDLTTEIFSINLLPIRFQVENNKKIPVSCEDAKIKEIVSCNGEVVEIEEPPEDPPEEWTNYSVTLDSSYNLADIYFIRYDENKYLNRKEIQMKWDVSSIPIEAEIFNVTLCTYIESCGSFDCYTGAASLVNIEYVEDQNWDEDISLVELDSQTTLNSTYVERETLRPAGKWKCIDIKEQFIESKTNGDDNLSLRMSSLSEGEIESVIKDGGLQISEGYGTSNLEDRENSLESGNRPYLEIEYALQN